MLVQGFAKNAAERWSLSETLEAARLVRESLAARPRGLSEGKAAA